MGLTNTVLTAIIIKVATIYITTFISLKIKRDLLKQNSARWKVPFNIPVETVKLLSF
jgi:hypothetical protein